MTTETLPAPSSGSANTPSSKGGLLFRLGDHEDAEQATRVAMAVYSTMLRDDPDSRARMRVTPEQILKVIDEDADIGILVLAAGIGKDGPGPLISHLAKTAGEFPIPVAVIPGHLSDADIDAMS